MCKKIKVYDTTFRPSRQVNLPRHKARVRETRRPVLITQNGRAVSYLVDAKFLDNVFDQIELARDINISSREFAEGKGIPHEEVFDRLHKKLIAMKDTH